MSGLFGCSVQTAVVNTPSSDIDVGRELVYTVVVSGNEPRVSGLTQSVPRHRRCCLFIVAMPSICVSRGDEESSACGQLATSAKNERHRDRAVPRR